MNDITLNLLELSAKDFWVTCYRLACCGEQEERPFEKRHPRFLLHDGPRVADLSPSIHQRYFEFAADLEKRAGGKPNFQYIITTTEPPPPEFQVEPYLRLRLDASRPEDRLLKRDL